MLDSRHTVGHAHHAPAIERRSERDTRCEDADPGEAPDPDAGHQENRRAGRVHEFPRCWQQRRSRPTRRLSKGLRPCRRERSGTRASGSSISNGVSLPTRTRTAAVERAYAEHDEHRCAEQARARVVPAEWSAEGCVAGAGRCIQGVNPRRCLHRSTKPTVHPLLSVDRIRNRDIGPSCRATKKPSPKPMSAACMVARL